MLTASNASEDNDEKCSNFQFYLFAQDWSPTLCIKYDKPGGYCIIPNNPENWVVHGLWPSADTVKDSPSFCGGGSKFTVDDMQSLLPELEQAWPNPDVEKRDETEGFKYWSWRHEWYKHGTCAAVCDPGVSDKIDYFKLVIDLDKTYDIRSTLSQAGIHPDDKTPLSTKSVEDAVHAAYGARPEVQCLSPEGSDTSYLFTIGLCLSPSNHEITDCPERDVPEDLICADNLIYPTTTP